MLKQHEKILVVIVLCHCTAHTFRLERCETAFGDTTTREVNTTKPAANATIVSGNVKDSKGGGAGLGGVTIRVRRPGGFVPVGQTGDSGEFETAKLDGIKDGASIDLYFYKDNYVEIRRSVVSAGSRTRMKAPVMLPPKNFAVNWPQFAVAMADTANKSEDREETYQILWRDIDATPVPASAKAIIARTLGKGAPESFKKTPKFDIYVTADISKLIIVEKAVSDSIDQGAVPAKSELEKLLGSNDIFIDIVAGQLATKPKDAKRNRFFNNFQTEYGEKLTAQMKGLVQVGEPSTMGG